MLILYSIQADFESFFESHNCDAPCEDLAELFLTKTAQIIGWTVPSSPCYSGDFLARRSIDNSMAKSIHFSIKSFMRA